MILVNVAGVSALLTKPKPAAKTTHEVNLLHLFHDMHSVVASSTGAKVIHTPETMYYDEVVDEREGEGVAWEDMLPSLYIPNHIDIDIYVVKLQQSYAPIG